jgi:glutamyl endopeptidase
MNSLREEIGSFPSDDAWLDPMETLRSDDQLSGLTSAWSLEFEQPTQERPGDLVQVQDVIGEDDRRRVVDTTQFPWNRICCLLVLYQSGARAVGTGWLAVSRTVLTAGHCVFLLRFGWAKSVQVIPGWNGEPLTSTPFGVHVSSQCLSVRAWVERGQGAYDCGAVILPQANAFNPPFVPIVAAPDSILQSREVAIAGYPEDRPTGTMWSHARALARFDPSFLFYDVDTEGGESGGPVLTLSEHGPVAVGVHTDGSSQGNFGVRITQEIEGIFQTWLNPA